MIASMSNVSELSAAEHPVVELVHPMPGFPDVTTFALRAISEDNLLLVLESGDVRFLVVPPGPFLPDYSPSYPDHVVVDLGMRSADDILVLLVVRAGASLAETKVNLRAPILINVTNGRALQVVLDDPELSVAAPLLG